MADSFTPSLNLRKPEVGAAESTWGGPAGLNGDLDLIDAVFLATGLGTSVGLHVGIDKTLNVEGSAQFADLTDPTKRVVLLSAGVTTGTTRALSFPDEDGTLATTGYVDTELGSSSMRLVSESVLEDDPSNTLQVTFPAEAKLVKLEWHAMTTGLANGSMALRGTVGGVVSTAAIYTNSNLVQSTTSVTGDFVTAQTGWIFTAAGAHTWGSATFNVPSIGIGTGDFALRNNAAARSRLAMAFETNGSVTFDGFHLGVGTTTWVVGSYLRCFALV